MNTFLNWIFLVILLTIGLASLTPPSWWITVLLWISGAWLMLDLARKLAK